MATGYIGIVIKRFRHRGLERLFTAGSARGVNPQFADKLRRMLKVLNDSREPQGMNLPNYRLHALHGDRKGQWAVWVSGNWRLVFEFEDDNATNVDLVDYH
jgi:proteic killer suppression protein